MKIIIHLFLLITAFILGAVAVNIGLYKEKQAYEALSRKSHEALEIKSLEKLNCPFMSNVKGAFIGENITFFPDYAKKVKILNLSQKTCKSLFDSKDSYDRSFKVSNNQLILVKNKQFFLYTINTERLEELPSRSFDIAYSAIPYENNKIIFFNSRESSREKKDEKINYRIDLLDLSSKSWQTIEPSFESSLKPTFLVLNSKILLRGKNIKEPLQLYDIKTHKVETLKMPFTQETYNYQVLKLDSKNILFHVDDQIYIYNLENTPKITKIYHLNGVYSETTFLSDNKLVVFQREKNNIYTTILSLKTGKSQKVLLKGIQSYYETEIRQLNKTQFVFFGGKDRYDENYLVDNTYLFDINDL